MSSLGRNVEWCEALYQERSTELLLYGRALGLSHSEAQDVIQETFLAMLKRPEVPSNPLHYCLRSFRNRALNYRRSLWRRLTRELESRRWFESTEGETDEERAAMEALAKLPQEQREVIVLKLWHRHTFEEIGDLQRTSPNTVAGRYRYGLQKLRHALKGTDYERDQRDGGVGETFALLGASPPIRGT